VQTLRYMKSVASPGSQKPAPDWERIELDYRAGILSLREIAAKHPGTNHVAIARKAKQEGWVRDLSEKIKSRANDLVTRELVTPAVTAGSTVSEKQVVEANALAIADVRLSHRKDIHRKRAILAHLMDELEGQVGPENAALLSEFAEIMCAPDENGQDKRNDLYQKIISLPERARTAKTLAETLRITVDMERQAFGMDAKGADSAPGSAGYVPPAVHIVHIAPPARTEDDE
jgi:hypothetical protein